MKGRVGGGGRDFSLQVGVLTAAIEVVERLTCRHPLKKPETLLHIARANEEGAEGFCVWCSCSGSQNPKAPMVQAHTSTSMPKAPQAVISNFLRGLPHL